MTDKKEVNIIVSENLEVFFSDIVRIEANPETVSLTFGIREPNGLDATARYRAIMTIPHFIRLADVCGKTAQNIVNSIEKSNAK